MGNNDKNPLGYSHEEIIEQLKKIQAEEDRLYGKQDQLFPLDISGKIPGEDGGFDREEESLLSNSEDPALCKKLFYKIQSVITSNTRKGKIRDFVNNEKRLYLKSTSNAGDSRFSFKNSLNKLLGITTEWARTDKNGIELGMSFYNLNEEEGFHKDKNIDQMNFPSNRLF